MNCSTCGQPAWGADSKGRPLCQKCAEKPEDNWHKMKRLAKPYRLKYLKASLSLRKQIRDEKRASKARVQALERQLFSLPEKIEYDQKGRELYEEIYLRKYPYTKFYG